MSWYIWYMNPCFCVVLFFEWIINLLKCYDYIEMKYNLNQIWCYQWITRVIENIFTQTQNLYLHLLGCWSSSCVLPYVVFLVCKQLTGWTKCNIILSNCGAIMSINLAYFCFVLYFQTYIPSVNSNMLQMFTLLKTSAYASCSAPCLSATLISFHKGDIRLSYINDLNI